MKLALLALFAAVMMVGASAQGYLTGPPPPGLPPLSLLGKLSAGFNGNGQKGFNGEQKAACRTTARPATTAAGK